MQTGEFLEFNDRHKAAARYGAPYYTFHRADLLDALASELDHSAIHLGHRLTGIEERSDRVMLAFANGAEVEAEIVIGADGVRSVIRRALYGDDNPTYTGQMVWRALLNGSDVPEEVLEPTGHIQWVGPGCHLLALLHPRRKLVNIVTQEDTDKWVEEGWSTRGDPDEMRLSFPNPEPRLAKLLSLVTECSKWGLFTRPLTQNWGRGRIQLIGDAAHAMLPNAGQGACQAFEDAYILARWLDACRDPVEAFANFRRIRIPRVHGVQRLSLSNARFKHMRDSAAQKDSDRRRQRQRPRQLRLGLALRSRRRMGQRAAGSRRLRGLSIRLQSTDILVASMMRAQRCCSPASQEAVSSGDAGRASPPVLANACSTSSEASAPTTALLSCRLISIGVPGGATIAVIDVMTN